VQLNHGGAAYRAVMGLAHEAENLDDLRRAHVGFLVRHFAHDAATASSPRNGWTPHRLRMTWPWARGLRWEHPRRAGKQEIYGRRRQSCLIGVESNQFESGKVETFPNTDHKAHDGPKTQT